MDDTYYRIICKRVGAYKNRADVVSFISSQFDISRKKTEFILNHPPAVLGDMNEKDKLEFCIANLRKFDISLAVQEIVKDPRLPFLISKPQLKLISKELSKAVRSITEATVFYLTIDSLDKHVYLPSLMGKKVVLEKSFRGCDSVYVIDDNHLMIFGFSTDGPGANALMLKIVEGVRELLGDSLKIRIGFAVFPKDGNSFLDLVYHSGNNTYLFCEENAFAGEKEIKAHSSDDDAGMQVSESQVFSLCFNKARGKFFHELTALGPEVLWSGLCRTSIPEQKNFFSRLPHDSPLIPVLTDKIKNQVKSEYPDLAKKKIRQIINRMQLLENLNERKLNNRHILEKLNNIETLSTLPSIALHVYNVASDPDSKVGDLVKVIMVDPSLTLKMLQIVNSSFYGFKQKISTVKEAVIVLGTDEVKNMAFGLALSKKFMEADLKGLVDPRHLWRHSLGTALVTSYMCQKFSDFKDAGIFTAGLLHDFGKIFLIENFPDLYKKTLMQAEETGIPTVAIEEEILGIDHATIGKLLSENWNLPESLTQAVSYHHHPSAAPDFPKFAAIVGFADYLCNMAFVEDQDMQGNRNKLNLMVDHMSYIKQVFSEFNESKINDAVMASRVLLDENKDLLSFVTE